MSDWQKTIVHPDTAIIKVIKIINDSSLQVALIVDDDSRLVGMITDGDIRRTILKGIGLENPVKTIMKTEFASVEITDNREKALAMMINKNLHHIPILDTNGCLCGLYTIDELMFTHKKDTPVVLMAGGKGARLQPLTFDCPKPLLKVGGKPILESIIESFIEQGFFRFYISVNYHAEMIESYFKDGSSWGVEIKYIKEEQPLGTVGALGMLKLEEPSPIIVMNGDILTKVDYRSLLEFHQEKQAQVTICVREYSIEIPYGVVEIENEYMARIEEKPVQRYLVNAGLYVLDYNTLDCIPGNRPMDMPELLKAVNTQPKSVAVFPIRDYWLDIGRKDDFERANGDFSRIFSKD